MVLTYTHYFTAADGIVYTKTLPTNRLLENAIRAALQAHLLETQYNAFKISIMPAGKITFKNDNFGVGVEFLGWLFTAEGDLDDADASDTETMECDDSTTSSPLALTEEYLSN